MRDLCAVLAEPVVCPQLLSRLVLSQLGSEPLTIASGEHCHVCLDPCSMLAEIPAQLRLGFLGRHGLPRCEPRAG